MPMSHSGMACAVLNNRIYSIGGYEGSANDVVNHVHILQTSVTAIEKRVIKPETLLLAKAYPNPFNGQVRIEINLPVQGQAVIDILNSTGQKISTIAAIPEKVERSGNFTQTDPISPLYTDPSFSSPIFSLT